MGCVVLCHHVDYGNSCYNGGTCMLLANTSSLLVNVSHTLFAGVCHCPDFTYEVNGDASSTVQAGLCSYDLYDASPLSYTVCIMVMTT
jgi:hypothetical protein